MDNEKKDKQLADKKMNLMELSSWKKSMKIVRSKNWLLVNDSIRRMEINIHKKTSEISKQYNIGQAADGTYNYIAIRRDFLNIESIEKVYGSL